MTTPDQIRHLDGLIREMKQTAEQIQNDSTDFPAVDRNIRRVLASIRMLEINVSDVSDL